LSCHFYNYPLKILQPYFPILAHACDPPCLSSQIIDASLHRYPTTLQEDVRLLESIQTVSNSARSADAASTAADPKIPAGSSSSYSATDLKARRKRLAVKVSMYV